MLRPLFLAALALTLASSLEAQRLGPPVDRPRLRDVTDTNDAQAYYDQGLALVNRDPGEAAKAFYWAARINPGWGEPLYARRTALLLDDRGLLKKYFERNRNSRRVDDLVRLDSLQFRALMLSPFLFRRLDRELFTTYIRNEMLRGVRGGAEPGRGELDYYIDNWLRESDAGTRAWLAYADGNFTRALDLYAMSMGDTKNKADVHVERARIFGMGGQVDSAVTEFDAALVDLRKRDQKDLVVFYDSKAQAEFSKAVLLEGAGNATAAREAYAQALTEDLSYYPAHLRLGLLALGAKDTTVAMNELALATQLAGDEPHVRYVNGYVLGVSGHRAEALTEMQKAVALEPYYALPYLQMGRLYEQLGKGPEALASYESFIAHASARDPQREYAMGRITEVKEIMTPVSP